VNNGFELTQNSGIITNSSGDGVIVSRKELQDERAYLLSRLQQIHRLLGLPPIQTGQQQRRQHCNN